MFSTKSLSECKLRPLFPCVHVCNTLMCKKNVTRVPTWMVKHNKAPSRADPPVPFLHAGAPLQTAGALLYILFAPDPQASFVRHCEGAFFLFFLFLSFLFSTVICSTSTTLVPIDGIPCKADLKPESNIKHPGRGAVVSVL